MAIAARALYAELGKSYLAASTTVIWGGFQTKTFPSLPFTTVPIIIATVVTQNEARRWRCRYKDITTTSFQIRLREQEANSQAHTAEIVHYLAWEPGSGTVNGLAFQVGSRTADHNFATVTFSPPFATIPAFVAGYTNCRGRGSVFAHATRG